MHANVTAHGSNSPWKELFLLLKVYQWSAEDTALLTPAQLCTAAGLIDSWVASPLSSETHSDDSLSQQAALIYQQLKFDNPEPVPQLSKPSHTIFMACAEADGTLTGITNSIFTPLGSLFEIDDTGIILSNRAFSFNGPHLGSTFKGNTAAKHTTNCVRVTTDHLEFIIGTSGGLCSPRHWRTSSTKLSLSNARFKPPCRARALPIWAGTRRQTALPI